MRPFRPRVALISIGAAWLLLMGGLVWWHASETIQPPVYDALGYFTKAKFVWADFARGDFFNFLAAEPAYRPPATVLMAYPFGFDGSYPGYYFRSVFFPIVLIFVAVYIVSWRPEWSRRDALSTALTACFLSTLSLLYYFEPYDGGPTAISYWGLVDCFQTGLAAVAAASAVRSVHSRSIGWGVAATVVGVLMIFVKPSGTLLAALVGMLLTVGWLYQLLHSDPATRQRRRTLAAVATLIALQCLLLGGSVLVAINSEYLGAASMDFGKAAIEVMRNEIHVDLAGYVVLARLGLGPFIPIWIVGALLLLVFRSRSQQQPLVPRRLDALFLTFSALVFVVGIWFWLVASGGRTEIRYFTPFLFISIVCIVGPLSRIVDGVGRPVRWVMSVVMLIALGNTVLLLALPSPALAWQVASGVNVKSGSRPAAIAQAQSVIDAIRPGTKSVVVYSMAVDVSDAMFQSLFHLHMLDAREPSLTVSRPLDWRRPTTFRGEELIASDYILFDPRKARPVLPNVVEDFVTEEIVFQSWARGLSSEDGVEVVSTQPASTLLRIVDRPRLAVSVDRLIAAHRWRPIFTKANVLNWWSAEEIDEALGPSGPGLKGIHFGEKFEAYAATLGLAADAETEFRIWLRSVDRSDDTGWILLVHYVDADGKILSAPDVALTRMSFPNEAKPYFYVHRKFLPPPGTAKVAIGVYRGGTLLVADKGIQDWGGKRVLLSLPDRPVAQ